MLHAGDVLAGIVHKELIALPLRNGGVRFHGIVVLNGRGIDLIDLDLGLLQAAFHIAKTQVARNSSVLAGIRRRKSCDEIELGSFLSKLSVD